MHIKQIRLCNVFSRHVYFYLIFIGCLIMGLILMLVKQDVTLLSYIYSTVYPA